MIQENVHNKKTRDFKVVDSEYIKIRHVCLYICIEEIVRKYTKNINRLLSGLQEYFFYIFLLWFCLLFKLHTKFKAVRLYFGNNYFLETSLR